MNGFMSFVLKIWTMYWGDSGYGVLLWVLLILLGILAINDQTARIYFIFLCVSLAVLFNPWGIQLFSWMIGEDVYWRMLWLLSFGVLASYVLTKVLQRISGRLLRWEAGILFLALAVLGGRAQWSSGNFIKTDNLMHLPDEIIEIADFIQEDAGEENPHPIVVCPNEIATYLRVYDPQILMPYGRNSYGAKTEAANTLYKLYSNLTSIENFVALATEVSCEYLVIPATFSGIQQDLEFYGYEELAATEAYIILKNMSPRAMRYENEEGEQEYETVD